MSSEQISSKQKRVIELRNEYLKQINNPYRHMTAEGGHVFDPAIYRFHAMRVSHYDHFKPNFKTFRIGFGLVVLPILLSAWAFKYERETREEKFRTGQVAYKDRLFKFI
ncbi:CLUMA_CG013139, isoform A [Clunio marinus]|uniref:NADH dehydrogenase [ubiquinone] 1 beta subcomplex subunit 4 n=1 Tax=Clunio marinus TaxID=568069 RepID=A0A1J1IHU4_9DIPT|nr:CLUMA_CG013139, isoform A [Clunio marinus]